MSEKKERKYRYFVPKPLPKVQKGSKYEPIIQEFLESNEPSGMIPDEIVKKLNLNIFGLRNLVKNRKLPIQVRSINKQIWLVRTDLEGETDES